MNDSEYIESLEDLEEYPIPILIRHNAVSLDEIIPHWTHYQTDEELFAIKENIPPLPYVKLPKENYTISTRCNFKFKII